MKKALAFIFAAAMMASFAGCGDSGSGKTSETEAEKTTAEIVQTTEAAEAVTEEPETTQASDEEMIAENKSKLVGDWVAKDLDVETLSFSEDGTGKYKNFDGEEISFAYELSVAHKAYGNGEEYVDNLMKVDYSSGESEDIMIDFREEGNTELVFHSSESGGYSGVMNFDVWTKK